MANIKSQIKRNRQNEDQRVRNKSVRTALKTSIKKTHVAVDDGDLSLAQSELRAASRALDKAASRGAIHKRSAARKKSRLARTVAGAPAAE